MVRFNEKAGVVGSREFPTQPIQALPKRLQSCWNSLWPLLLVLSLLVLPGSAGSCYGLGWPSRDRQQSPDGPARPLPASAPAGLQEVAPPPAIRQLQEALAGREPQVEILAPADGALLPPGPWNLQLRVKDWPLVNGGALGLGPHLVVQLDDEPPLRVTSTEITLPALRPGSHRLTVFAARPWGEAAKNPGAWSQIRLHRVAANPLALPEPGQAQLIAVSPSDTAATEPLLLDWLLLNAPLQNLRSDDGQWRLRVTINGDGFVLDQQTPLWLKGWKSGRNAIQLELLDGRGEPLNPPFNSLVREVELNRSYLAPSWQHQLSAGDLAILLGEAPPSLPIPAQESTVPTTVAQEPSGSRPNISGLVPDVAPEPASQTDLLEQPPSEPLVPEIPESAEAATVLEDPAIPSSSEGFSPSPGSELLDSAIDPPLASESAPGLNPESASKPEPEPRSASWGQAATAPDEISSQRLRPTSTLTGSARDQVNPDGTLIKPSRRGPLSGLRERQLP